MRTPKLVHADQLYYRTELVTIEDSSGSHIAKPLGLEAISLISRLLLAYKVFTGQYDALMYYGD